MAHIRKQIADYTWADILPYVEDRVFVEIDYRTYNIASVWFLLGVGSLHSSMYWKILDLTSGTAQREIPLIEQDKRTRRTATKIINGEIWKEIAIANARLHQPRIIKQTGGH